ncbi:MAG: sugar transferase [Bacteroidota bacterium]|nr:sugar transferase [Bacteroidota bacterium]MDP3144338.1 sugar transferase [Bacteroidota bacterium]
MKEHIINKSGEETYSFISHYLDPESKKTLIISTTNDFNITNYPGDLNSIVNLSKVNNIRYINKFFEKVNAKLINGDVFICCFETIASRKERHRLGNIPILKNIWFGAEFVFLRMFPKIWGLKKIYFLVTRGRNRLLSKAEVMGRLVSCGFSIEASEAFNGITYAVCKKIKEPVFNMGASYGPIFKMQRVGKNGKTIGVYKFRTMHPYAEYLQDYVLNLNGYADSGKPKDDFRLTPWGRFLRRYWLDELPQLINVCKGELKLVGVRPISERYFQDIPKDLQVLRSKFKPGCIPPYVALNRKSDVASVLQSEREYLQEKIKRAYTTDTRFFFKAIFNIVFKRKRSA